MLVQLQTGEKEQDFSLLPIQVSISVQLWRLPGCHEFLAALGESAVKLRKLLIQQIPTHHVSLWTRCYIYELQLLCPCVHVQGLTYVRSAKKKWC